MTVGQLREALEGFCADALVVMSKDGEGNSYSPLAEPSEAVYIAESTWSGELWTTEDEDEEVPVEAVHAVVLWPVN